MEPKELISGDAQHRHLSASVGDGPLKEQDLCVTFRERGALKVSKIDGRGGSAYLISQSDYICGHPHISLFSNDASPIAFSVGKLS